MIIMLFIDWIQTACKVEGHSTRHGSKAENRPKNQNQKIIPCKSNCHNHSIQRSTHQLSIRKIPVKRKELGIQRSS